MHHQDVQVIRADEHASHYQITDASCFYFPILPLQGLIQAVQQEKKELVALPGRIEVSDKNGSLHYHHGVTIAFITAGFGIVKTLSKDIPIRTGDIILIPSMARHLSIAAQGTTMTEHIVFLGAKDDLQAVYDA